jgi:hypothetical protein
MYPYLCSTYRHLRLCLVAKYFWSIWAILQFVKISVSNNLMSLAVNKDCSIIYFIVAENVLFLKYWKNNSQTLYSKTEVLLCQAVKYYDFVILQF